MAPAGAWSPLATCRAASIALPSEGVESPELVSTRPRPDPAPGRSPGRGVVPASHPRELFPRGRSWQQVLGEQGGAGWSRAPRRPVNQRRRAPGRPPRRCQCLGGEAGAVTTSRSGIARLGKGDVIVAGRFREPANGRQRRGSLSVALGQS